MMLAEFGTPCLHMSDEHFKFAR